MFQYVQSHCQHHVHKLVRNPKTGEKKRMIPNACACKNNPKECKHEAPWTNRVSPKWMTQPLLVCKGLAKYFGLRTSGVRNWMGQILGMRNEEWLNGCMPGMCMAFAGSNSDVKLNDRLPITEDTHEQCCKKQRCLVKHHNLKKNNSRITKTSNHCYSIFWWLHWKKKSNWKFGSWKMCE